MTPITATGPRACEVWEQSAAAHTTTVKEVQSYEVKPASQPEDWLKRTLLKVQAFGAYSPNWDSYGSPPPTSTAQGRALLLLAFGRLFFHDLPEPQIAPSPGGGIQIDWTHDNRDLEISILPNGTAEYLLVENDNPLEEGTLSYLRVDSRTGLRRILRWILDR